MRRRRRAPYCIIRSLIHWRFFKSCSVSRPLLTTWPTFVFLCVLRAAIPPPGETSNIFPSCYRKPNFWHFYYFWMGDRENFVAFNTRLNFFSYQLDTKFSIANGLLEGHGTPLFPLLVYWRRKVKTNAHSFNQQSTWNTSRPKLFSSSYYTSSYYNFT